MSHLFCSICHRQFRSSSGLRWHLGRIHDQAADPHWPGTLAETRELARGENMLPEQRSRAEEDWASPRASPNMAPHARRHSSVAKTWRVGSLTWAQKSRI